MRLADVWERCYCSRLVPPSQFHEMHGCCDDCYWSLPDSRAERFAIMCQLDRDRLLDEARD